MKDEKFMDSCEKNENLLNEKHDIYKGEMYVTTHTGKSGHVKHVYTNETFVKDNCFYLNPEDKDLTLQYDVNTLKTWIENKIIQKEDGEELINEIIYSQNKIQEYLLWIKNNPNLTEQEKATFNKFPPYKDMEKYSVSLRRILAKKEVINNFRKSDLLHRLFSHNIDHQSDFGMTKRCAEGLSNLPELLCNATFQPIIDNMWRLAAKIKSKTNKVEIELEYNFLASSQEEAEKVAATYKDTLHKGGLKVLLAYWKKASEIGKVIYTCALRDVMALCSTTSRSSYYNMEERKRFWMLTRILENTKMSIPLTFVKNRKKTTLKVEHRFLEILNRSEEEEEGCPMEIKIRLIDTEVFAEQTQLATAIANNILSLDENDVMIALSLEVRASQRRQHKGIHLDKDYLINQGGLSKSAETNPRVAKKRVGEKLDRLKNAGVGAIDWHKTSKDTYFIETKKRPEKIKKPPKI